MDETLGLLGHPGGILVDHPRLRVGLVSAISRPDSLHLDLIARSPYSGNADRPAPRVLLPRYDEGLHLRVARLDADGRAHWEYGAVDLGTGPAFGGTILRTRLRLPATFGSVKLVLAWPEIAFPEAVVTLPLPDREAVSRAATSIWTAPVDNEPASPTREEPATQEKALEALDVHPEAGLVLFGPRVLHRGGDAVVVLTRLTLVGAALSMEIRCSARGHHGGAATMAGMYGRGNGASVALLRGDVRSRLDPSEGSTAGGDDVFEGCAEYAFERPERAFLTLVVGWPEAGLADAVVRVPLEQG